MLVDSSMLVDHLDVSVFGINVTIDIHNLSVLIDIEVSLVSEQLIYTGRRLYISKSNVMAIIKLTSSMAKPLTQVWLLGKVFLNIQLVNEFIRRPLETRCR